MRTNKMKQTIIMMTKDCSSDRLRESQIIVAKSKVNISYHRYSTTEASQTSLTVA